MTRPLLGLRMSRSSVQRLVEVARLYGTDTALDVNGQLVGPRWLVEAINVIVQWCGVRHASNVASLLTLLLHELPPAAIETVQRLQGTIAARHQVEAALDRIRFSLRTPPRPRTR